MTPIRLFSVVSAAALMLVACAGASGTGTRADEGSTTTVAGISDGVHVAPSELGDILVGPDGGSLYVFTADSEGASACTGSCADSWPPLSADVGLASDLDQSIFTSITRDDGTDQLAVNGMPLYYYAADSGPGDTSGYGLNDAWFVVDPFGTKIQGGAEETDDSIIDY